MCGDSAVLQSDKPTGVVADPCMDDQAVFEALRAVPETLRRYFTPGIAMALALFRRGVSLQISFKVSAAAGRKRCSCCLLRNKPRCCIGRSQLERAAHHACKFCTDWILMGYGSARPLGTALGLATDDDILCRLRDYHSNNLLPGPHCCRNEVQVSIPHVIHQIWIGPDPPPLRWIDTWRLHHTKVHPSWQHRLWRDEDIMSLLTPALRHIYDRLDQWCLKADIARYAILEEHGGVYVDADMIWLEQEGLGFAVEGRAFVLAFESPPSHGFGMDERIGNAVMGVPPHDPLISRILSDIVSDFAELELFLGKDSPFLQQYKIGYRLTSPVAVTRAFLDLQMDLDSLLPTDLFFPVPWWRGQSLSCSSEQTRIDFPSAICTHYGYSTNHLGNSTKAVECIEAPRYSSISAQEEFSALESASLDGYEHHENRTSIVSNSMEARSSCDSEWRHKAMTERQQRLWQTAMDKVRHDRETAKASMVLPPAVEETIRSLSFAALCARRTSSYDTSSHTLRESFLASIGRPELELDRWHTTVPDFSTSSPSIVFQHKAILLDSLKDQSSRSLFEKAYHRFVLEVVAPEMAATMACHGDKLKKLHYAAFPCIRIVPPCSNWTIRPHADFMYGHPVGSINIWVPLTTASGSNTLFAETSPGGEEFVPMNLEYGQACRWYGTMCAHFTLPNISDQTRVSLDFRVIPETAYYETELAYVEGSYYATCEIDADGLWHCSREGSVSGQHGFPFTMPKMKYY